MMKDTAGDARTLGKDAVQNGLAIVAPVAQPAIGAVQTTVDHTLAATDQAATLAQNDVSGVVDITDAVGTGATNLAGDTASGGVTVAGDTTGASVGVAGTAGTGALTTLGSQLTSSTTGLVGSTVGGLNSIVGGMLSGF